MGGPPRGEVGERAGIVMVVVVVGTVVDEHASARSKHSNLPLSSTGAHGTVPPLVAASAGRRGFTAA